MLVLNKCDLLDDAQRAQAPTYYIILYYIILYIIYHIIHYTSYITVLVDLLDDAQRAQAPTRGLYIIIYNTQNIHFG